MNSKKSEAFKDATLLHCTAHIGLLQMGPASNEKGTLNKVGSKLGRSNTATGLKT